MKRSSSSALVQFSLGARRLVVPLAYVLSLSPVLLPGGVRAERAVVEAFNEDLRPGQITELNQNGKHYQAILALFNSTAELGNADKASAANSAWALGLVNRARELWDSSLAALDAHDTERARGMLARSIMELQEKNYEEARTLAERSAGELPASELRGQLWLVIAEALQAQQALKGAEEYYQKAIKEGTKELQSEASYRLGECQASQGLLAEARFSFTAVSENSRYAAKALRRLAELDLKQQNYEGVLTWIAEGRESFSREFRDGWMSYAQISSLLALNRKAEAAAELKKLKSSQSEQDTWFVLAESAVEAAGVVEVLPHELKGRK